MKYVVYKFKYLCRVTLVSLKGKGKACCAALKNHCWCPMVRLVSLWMKKQDNNNHNKNKESTSIAETLVLHFAISNRFVSDFTRNFTLQKTIRNTNHFKSSQCISLGGKWTYMGNHRNMLTEWKDFSKPAQKDLGRLLSHNKELIQNKIKADILVFLFLRERQRLKLYSSWSELQYPYTSKQGSLRLKLIHTNLDLSQNSMLGI